MCGDQIGSGKCRDRVNVAYLRPPPPIPRMHLVVDPILAMMIDPVSLWRKQHLLAVRRITVELLHQLQRVAIDDFDLLSNTFHRERKRFPFCCRC